MNCKTIHYCWFGGNPIPEKTKKCIESWKKFFPDYEIVKWDENNFNINICQYVQEAYNEKKWAFVSDYARFWILYNYGGLYFDTDVEIIKEFTSIIKEGPFMGCEPSFWGSNISMSVNPGLAMGAAPGLDLYKEILSYYNKQRFLDDSGNRNLETVVTRTTNILKKYGFNENNIKIQKISGIQIYPPEYFCPLNYDTYEMNITENTVAIHWYDESWLTVTNKIKRKIRKILMNLIGKENFYKLKKILKKK